jgi:hypothetical protein
MVLLRLLVVYQKARPHQSGAGVRFMYLIFNICAVRKRRKALKYKVFSHIHLNRVPTKPKPRPNQT